MMSQLRSVLMVATARLSDWLGWWLRELSWFLPPILRNLFAAPLWTLQIEINDDQVSLFRRRSGLLNDSIAGQPLASGTWPELAGTAGRFLRFRGRLTDVAVLLPAGQYLVRKKRIPLAALANTEEILRLDLERATPFKSGDVLAGWAKVDGDVNRKGQLVRQFVVKREKVEDVLADLQRGRAPLSSVSLVGADGALLPVNLLPARGRFRQPLNRIFRRIAVFMAIGLAVLLAAAAAIKIYQQSQYLADLESRTAALRSQAQRLAQEISGLQAAAGLASLPRQQQLRRRPVVAVLDEVTRVLPVTAWTSEFTLDADEVRLAGFASSAADLIATFERSAVFANVRFTSPVIRDDATGLERFRLRMEIVQEWPEASGATRKKSGVARTILRSGKGE